MVSNASIEPDAVSKIVTYQIEIGRPYLRRSCISLLNGHAVMIGGLILTLNLTGSFPDGAVVWPP